MKPYDGTEVWMYFVFALFAITAIASIVTAFRIEKDEKSQFDPVIATGIRQKKYFAFGGFAVSTLIILVFAFIAQPVSQGNYQKNIKSYIESQGVSLVEGFVDPSMPLTSGTQVKFVIDSDAGVLRCRANAGNADEDVMFVCQDTRDKERDFTIPLSEVNNPENNSVALDKTSDGS